MQYLSRVNPIKVAVIQFAPVFKDVEANLDRLRILVEEAAQNGAKVVVCPELSTTGYSFMSEDDARPYAEALNTNCPSMKVLVPLALQYRIAIAWGTVELKHSTDKLYNSQVFLSSSGRFWSYSKINFYGNDFLWATKGEISPPIINYRSRKIGLLICADIQDKGEDIDDFYSPGDADIVLFSSNFGAGAFPARKWISFAKSNKTWLAVSNRYGEEVNNNFGHGGVCIISPEGKVHCDGLAWDRDCIVYADIP